MNRFPIPPAMQVAQMVVSPLSNTGTGIPIDAGNMPVPQAVANTVGGASSEISEPVQINVIQDSQGQILSLPLQGPDQFIASSNPPKGPDQFLYPKAKIQNNKEGQEILVTETLGTFLMGEDLGEGEQAFVRLMTSEQGEKLAYKELFKPLSRKILTDAEYLKFMKEAIADGCATAEDQEELSAAIRMMREFKSSQKLKPHPHIAKTRELVVIAGERDLRLALLMDFIEGQSLDKWLDKHSFTEIQIRDIAKQISSAINYLAENNLTHRDLKPGNVMLNQKKDGLFHATVLDLGVVKDHSGTKTGTVMGGGSYAYMAKEQHGNNQVGKAADVFAASLVYIDLILGRPHTEHTGTRNPNLDFNELDQKVKEGKISKGLVYCLKQMADYEDQEIRLKGFENLQRLLNNEEIKIEEEIQSKKSIFTQHPEKLILGGLAAVAVGGLGFLALPEASILSSVLFGAGAVTGLSGSAKLAWQWLANVKIKNEIETVELPKRLAEAKAEAEKRKKEEGAKRAEELRLQKLAEEEKFKKAEAERIAREEFFKKTIEERIKIAKEWSLPDISDLPEWLKNVLVPIPAGEFDMGSTEYGDEKPVHRVVLGAFYMMDCTVTNAMWKKFKGRSPSPAGFHGDDQPVVNVSYLDAVEFADWVTSLCEGKVKFALPTEAQWEWSARGGDSNQKWATGSGNISQSEANYGHVSLGKTANVYTYPPNAFALYQMSGNVWEWCKDWYDAKYYAQCEKEGIIVEPQGPDKGVYRVLRGGSYSFNEFLCRSSDRHYFTPSNRNDDVGFRLAAVLPRTP